MATEDLIEKQSNGLYTVTSVGASDATTGKPFSEKDLVKITLRINDTELTDSTFDGYMFGWGGSTDKKGNASFFIRVNENIPELVKRLQKFDCKYSYLMDPCIPELSNVCSCHPEKLINGSYTFWYIMAFIGLLIFIILTIIFYIVIKNTV